MWRKACPRCHGDLVVEHGPREMEIYCIQCGYNPPDEVVAALGQRKDARATAQPLAAVAKRIA